MGFRDQTWLLLWHAVLHDLCYCSCNTCVHDCLLYAILAQEPFWSLKHWFEFLPTLHSLVVWGKFLEKIVRAAELWWSTLSTLDHKELREVGHSSNFYERDRTVCPCWSVRKTKCALNCSLSLYPFLPTCMPKALKVSLESESLRVWFMNQRVR